MPQFFLINGKWKPLAQAREHRRVLDIYSKRCCLYCNTRAFSVHKKECPTRKPNFNPLTSQKVDMEGNPIE
jgi:hypothetical protein